VLRSVARTAALVAGSMLAVAVAAPASAGAIQSAGVPPGFDDLARPHELLVDIYFGGSKVGEAMAVASPGKLRFTDPQKVLAFVPQVAASPRLIAALEGDLPTHSELICSPGNVVGCGELSPELAGIIFDEDRFRATLFFAPSLLGLTRPVAGPYLPPPSSPLSLTSSLGLALSGSTGGSPSYNVQNRTILSFGRARIRADSSYASRLGLIVDDLAAEVDRRNLRYSAGLFWAPGLDLTGERRIAGVGVGTQFDTRADRDILEGTPLVLFLAAPAEVDMLVDGRLVGSRQYGAGNNVLDTSALPDGSYPVVLRIREQNGSVRDEQRFFVKAAQIAPSGEPLYFAYAGMLANTRRDTPISLSNDFYFQLGTARRLSRSLAVDVSAIGARGKTMVETGAWLMTRAGRGRIAGLASASGDYGALLQLGSSGRGPLNFNLDLRRVWSSDGKPLIPIAAPLDNFGSTAPTGAQLGEGSYTQISASIGLTVDRAYLSVIGSLRHDDGLGGDYSIGPNLSWPVVSSNGLELVLQADAQRTRTTSAAFLGARLQFTSNRLALVGTLGGSARSAGHGDGASSELVGSIAADYFEQAGDRTQVSAEAGFDRSLDSSTVHAAGSVYSSLGSARAEIVQAVDGGGGLQYALALQTGAALERHDAAVGGRDLEESALVVSLDGEPGRSAFDLLVDEQPRARLVAGQRIPIFLQPYHSYKVRIRPAGPTSSDFDSATRSVTLYPGNVEHLSWSIRSLFTVFGRAVAADGRPLANAEIHSGRGIGETDDKGYFQMDVESGDMLSFATQEKGSCSVRIAGTKPGSDFLSLGKVICR
jgi:Mat/Ecp fimbriae outer membrane usher protein